MASNPTQTDKCPAGEPSLEEMFAEPIVQLIMERDGTSAFDIRSQISNLIRQGQSYATA